MGQIPMIVIPEKKTEEIDWVAPLKKYIEAVYMDDGEKYSEELKTFNRIRQDMRGAGSIDTGRDLLYRYFGQLDLLELRFQVDENHVKISFPWQDSFTNKSISQYSLAYEKACVIYNIASSVSHTASQQARHIDENLKIAYHNFQLAAGILTYINENFLHAPSSDLNRDVIKVLIQFMLAQAQECFLEKCLSEKKKPSLVAKLASQLNYLYTSIVDSFSDGLPKKLFPQIYLLLAKLKVKFYSSVAQFYKAKALDEEAEYGEAVSRYTLAESLANEAYTQAKAFTRVRMNGGDLVLPNEFENDLLETTKRNHEEFLQKKEASIKDNDLIYHQPVINSEVLTPIDKLMASKVIPFNEIYSPTDLPKIIGPDIFCKLVPLSVHESASLYSEEMAKITRAETERVDTADSELDASLLYLELPGCLDKYQVEENDSLQKLTIPPEDILKLNSDIYSYEKQNGSIVLGLSNLPKANKELKLTLDECTNILDLELRDSEQLRNKYLDNWSQVPSSTAASHLRHEVKQNRELLSKAMESDNLMFSKFNASKENINMIKSDPSMERIDQLYAETISSASARMVNEVVDESLLDVDKVDPITEKVNSIKENIDKLYSLKKERKDVLEDLKEQVKQDDISALLLLNKKTTSVEPQIFANELEKYRSHRDRITTTIHHQQATLQTITELMKEIISAEPAKKRMAAITRVEKERDQLTRKLNKAGETFYEVFSGTKDGAAFYDQLRPIIQSLLTKVKSFSEERYNERIALQRSIDDQKQDNTMNLMQSKLKMLDNVGNNSSTDNIERMMGNLNLGQNLSQSDNSPDIYQKYTAQSTYQQNYSITSPTESSFVPSSNTYYNSIPHNNHSFQQPQHYLTSSQNPQITNNYSHALSPQRNDLPNNPNITLNQNKPQSQLIRDSSNNQSGYLQAGAYPQSNYGIQQQGNSYNQYSIPQQQYQQAQYQAPYMINHSISQNQHTYNQSHPQQQSHQTQIYSQNTYQLPIQQRPISYDNKAPVDLLSDDVDLTRLSNGSVYTVSNQSYQYQQNPNYQQSSQLNPHYQQSNQHYSYQPDPRYAQHQQHQQHQQQYYQQSRPSSNGPPLPPKPF